MNKNNQYHNRFKKNLLSNAISVAIIPLVLGVNLSTFAAEENKNTKEINNPEEMEVIEVTGILGSLEASSRIKRYDDRVVDAITSEDIGQFADDSIAGAIQRIPGVQIETDDAGTDGDRVSIRGLGPEFVNSTLNGRRLLSSGNEGKSLRKMNFNSFPPNVLSGVKVAKSSNAVSPESGLAGQVDLETLKPLEIRKLKKKNSYTALSVRAGTNEIDNEVGGRFSVLSALRNDENDLGGYISLVVGEEKNARDQVRLNYQDRDISLDHTGDGNADEIIENVSIISAVTMNPIRETAERVAFATGIQYQPNEDVDINWDLMYSRYNNQSTRNQFQFSINGNNVWRKSVFDQSNAGNPGIVIEDIQNGNSGETASFVKYANFGLADGASTSVSARTTSMLFDNDTKNLITGLNVDWAINDKLSANFDGYVSTVDYSQDLRFARFGKDLDNSDFIFNSTGEIPEITAPGVDDLDGYGYLQGSIREISTEAENYGFTANFTYDIDDNDIFSSVNFGIHYDETDIDAKRTSGNNSKLTDYEDNDDGSKGDYDADMLAAGLTGELLDQDFIDGEFAPTRWSIADYDAIVAADPRLATLSFKELGVDPLQSYEMTESILALHSQVNLNTEIFGLPLTGNFGVRAVLTDTESTAVQDVDGVSAPITVGNDYWEILPSFNLNLSVQENMALRFAISRTISRPDYQDLAPINRINVKDEGEIGTATIGNPDLDPMSSVNFDITYEWYTKNDAAFVFSLFYKEVSDFIIQDTISAVPLPGYDDSLLFNTKTNFNASDGNAKGMEIGLLQPLGKLIPALDGFGFSTNYTYVDSEFDEDVGDAGFGFPGSSQDNFNFIGFYEEDFYSIRLAYTYRSSFFRSLQGTGSQSSKARFSGEQEKLNVNVNIKPTKGLSIKLSANNITGEKRRDFIGQEDIFMDYFDRGRTYSITANYKF